jgi:ribosomal protein S18 acetylase RimI-like enzyme
MGDPGAVILKCVEGEDVLTGCVYLQKRGSALYLGMLSVAPVCQGGGIGKALLEAAVEHGRQTRCDRIHITVISVRHELIAWYERHGYVRTGEIEPFHAGEKVGIQLQPLELVVLERGLGDVTSDRQIN